MREIEFRFWNSETEEMYQVLSIAFPKTEKERSYIEYSNPSGTKWGFTPDFHSVKLMQYTGLKDKNGKKIFEGDIVRSKKGKVQVVEFGEYTDGVNGFIGFFVREAKSELPYLFSKDDEVIGNKWQNPELLEVE